MAWSETTTLENGADAIIHSACIGTTDSWEIDAILASCIERAVTLLAVNINDDSLYLMFEWDAATSTLGVVVTDDSKSRDAKHRVICDMAGMNSTVEQLAQSDQWKYRGESFADIVKHGLRDYLTTCTGFMRYSLVAVFHQGSRQQTELL